MRKFEGGLFKLIINLFIWYMVVAPLCLAFSLLLLRVSESFDNDEEEKVETEKLKRKLALEAKAEDEDFSPKGNSGTRRFRRASHDEAAHFGIFLPLLFLTLKPNIQTYT